MTQIVIVTTTFYKSVSELRFQLALRMIEVAVACGHKVVIVDGSPISSIGSYFRNLGAEVFPQLHKGMGPSRREAFLHATEVAHREGLKYVLWTEPEKEDLIRFIPKIVAKFEEGNDIVIPARSEVSWLTWPEFQVVSEVEANAVYQNAFGMEGYDPMFGPVAFRLSMAKYFIESRGGGDIKDTYIQHYAPIRAYMDCRADIAKVEIDMIYPPEQKRLEGEQNAELVDKRRQQNEDLIRAYRTLESEMMATR